VQHSPFFHVILSSFQFHKALPEKFVSGGHIIKRNFSTLQGCAFHNLKGPPIIFIIFIVSMKPTLHFLTIPATYPSTLANSKLIIFRNFENLKFYFFQIKKYCEE
jgi:hypothetical protein